MKKLLQLIVVSVCLSFTATAQLSIPNGGMENWTILTHNEPQNYTQSSNIQAFYRCGSAFNCLRVADPYHGNYAIQLTTLVGTMDTCLGYFLNGNPSGPPSSWAGGIPYNQMATGMQGYYKSAIQPGDVGHVFVDFKANDTSIGFYAFNFTGTQSSYTPFSLTFVPPLSVTPDSVIFGAVSSDAFNNINIPGSMLQLDSISFTGVTSQPALLNGDFENWVPNDIYSLDNWYMISGGSNPGSGVTQTVDANAGNFALEMITTAGDNNGVPRAQPGMEGTGYYVCPNGGGGNCTLQGGYPFTNMVDTLCFYYKYAPATATDTALVSMIFKYNGSQTYGVWGYMTAAATYQYMEVPINLFSACDSVITIFQSTLWQDSLLTSIGSDLKVDNVHFKSQNLVTGIVNHLEEDGMFIAPNPFTSLTTITFAKEQKNTSLKVVDVLGNAIIETTINTRQYTIDMSSFAKGVYFVELTDANNLKTIKKIVVQ